MPYFEPSEEAQAWQSAEQERQKEILKWKQEQEAKPEIFYPQGPQVPTPTPVQVDPMGGLGAYAQPAGYGMGMQQMNPETLAMLLKRFGTGGTSSYAKRIEKGLKTLPGYQEELQEKYSEIGELASKRARAESEIQRLKGLALTGHQTALKAQYMKHEAEKGKIEAKIKDFEAEAASLRAEVAADKIDPDQWWSSRTSGQRLSLLVGSMLQGFVSGYYGQTGPTAISQAINTAIDRDIKAQVQNINKKRGDLASVSGAVADLYRRSGNLDNSINQARIMLTDQLKTKLEQIQASNAAPIIKQRAAMASMQMEMGILGMKNKAFQDAQEKVVITKQGTKTSGGFPQLMSIMKSMQGKPLKEPEQAIKNQIGNIYTARMDMSDFLDEYKELTFVPGALSWWGGRSDAVNEARKRLIDRIVAGTVPGGGSTEHLKMFKKALGNSFSSDKDVVHRIELLNKELSNREESIYRQESKYRNMIPLVEESIKSRTRFDTSMYDAKGTKETKETKKEK